MTQMLWSTVALLAVVQLGCAGAHPPREAASTSPSSPLTANALTDAPVIGSLGLPLGTVTEIECSVFNGQETRMKEFSSSYLLRVKTVNGHPLAQPVEIPFVVGPGASADLAEDPFSLYKRKTGRDPAQLSSNDIAELEKDYVGKPRRLIVYETGGFSGVPRDNPADLPYAIWQDHMWAFTTHVEVLGERP
jgi:hypothetical protein